MTRYQNARACSNINPDVGNFRIPVSVGVSFVQECHSLDTVSADFQSQICLLYTSAHKIPVTILSRCQRYDFKRISIETICDRLNELIEKEGLDVEDKAVRYIARMADGGMRDALSLLDQCVAFYIGRCV